MLLNPIGRFQICYKFGEPFGYSFHNYFKSGGGISAIFHRYHIGLHYESRNQKANRKENFFFRGRIIFLLLFLVCNDCLFKFSRLPEENPPVARM